MNWFDRWSRRLIIVGVVFTMLGGIAVNTIPRGLWWANYIAMPLLGISGLSIIVWLVLAFINLGQMIDERDKYFAEKRKRDLETYENTKYIADKLREEMGEEQVSELRKVVAEKLKQ